jgi:hypothetical protein
MIHLQTNPVKMYTHGLCHSSANHHDDQACNKPQLSINAGKNLLLLSSSSPSPRPASWLSSPRVSWLEQCALLPSDTSYRHNVLHWDTTATTRRDERTRNLLTMVGSPPTQITGKNPEDIHGKPYMGGWRRVQGSTPGVLTSCGLLLPYRLLSCTTDGSTFCSVYSWQNGRPGTSIRNVWKLTSKMIISLATVATLRNSSALTVLANAK